MHGHQELAGLPIGGSMDKNLPCSARDASLMPGSGRSVLGKVFSSPMVSLSLLVSL